MKQILFLMMCAAAFFAASCATVVSVAPERGAPPEREGENWSVFTYAYDDAVPLPDGTTATVNYDFSLLERQGSAAEVAEVNNLFYNGETPAAFANKVTSEFGAAWHNEIALYGSDALESLSWYYTEKIAALPREIAGITVIRHLRDNFMGGAHPVSSVLYHIYDESAPVGNRWRSALEDYCVPEAEQSRDFSALLRACVPAAAQATLFPDEIVPTDNAYPAENGFVFYYNPADIAPYSTGPVAIEVPWEKMAPFLNEAGKMLRY